MQSFKGERESAAPGWRVLLRAWGQRPQAFARRKQSPGLFVSGLTSPPPAKSRRRLLLYLRCAGQTGKEQRVQVPDNKEVANHVVPESCAAGCEARREALTGVRIGQPLSRDRRIVLGADAVVGAEGHTFERVIASARSTRRGRRPWHVRTFLVWEPGDLQPDRRRPLWPAARVGKARSRSR